MIPLHGIACFCDIGFGARAVSRKTPIFFIKKTTFLEVREDNNCDAIEGEGLLYG